MTDDDTIGGTDPSEGAAPALDPSAATDDRPPSVECDPDGAGGRAEIFVAGAFLGGLAAALLLRRVARG